MITSKGKWVMQKKSKYFLICQPTLMQKDQNQYLLK